MTLKQTLKKTMEGILVTTPLWATLGVAIVPPIIESPKYNSLSNQEKIVYLEDKLNTTYQNPPPIAFCPRVGGAPLAIWYEQKRYVQEELSKLKGGKK
jgi:hypothetical protein